MNKKISSIGILTALLLSALYLPLALAEETLVGVVYRGWTEAECKSSFGNQPWITNDITNLNLGEQKYNEYKGPLLLRGQETGCFCGQEKILNQDKTTCVDCALHDRNAVYHSNENAEPGAVLMVNGVDVGCRCAKKEGNKDFAAVVNGRCTYVDRSEMNSACAARYGSEGVHTCSGQEGETSIGSAEFQGRSIDCCCEPNYQSSFNQMTQKYFCEKLGDGVTPASALCAQRGGAAGYGNNLIECPESIVKAISGIGTPTQAEKDDANARFVSSGLGSKPDGGALYCCCKEGDLFVGGKCISRGLDKCNAIIPGSIEGASGIGPITQSFTYPMGYDMKFEENLTRRVTQQNLNCYCPSGTIPYDSNGKGYDSCKNVTKETIDIKCVTATQMSESLEKSISNYIKDKKTPIKDKDGAEIAICDQQEVTAKNEGKFSCGASMVGAGALNGLTGLTIGAIILGATASKAASYVTTNSQAADAAIAATTSVGTTPAATATAARQAQRIAALEASETLAKSNLEAARATLASLRNQYGATSQLITDQTRRVNQAADALLDTSRRLISARTAALQTTATLSREAQRVQLAARNLQTARLAGDPAAIRTAEGTLRTAANALRNTQMDDMARLILQNADDAYRSARAVRLGMFGNFFSKLGKGTVKFLKANWLWFAIDNGGGALLGLAQALTSESARAALILNPGSNSVCRTQLVSDGKITEYDKEAITIFKNTPRGLSEGSGEQLVYTVKTVEITPQYSFLGSWNVLTALGGGKWNMNNLIGRLFEGVGTKEHVVELGYTQRGYICKDCKSSGGTYTCECNKIMEYTPNPLHIEDGEVVADAVYI
jgi:hypothetical protein